MTNLLEYLPPVRGKIEAHVPLQNMTYLHVGGDAEVFFEPADSDDLIHFLRKHPAAVPITVLGAGSNVLVRDGGIPGVVIHLGDWFKRIFKEGTTFEVGAGALVANFAENAAQQDVSGFEFLSTIPGTMGGCILMNAGCFGRSIKDILLEMEAVDFQGRMHWMPAQKIGLTYRKSSIPNDWIILRAWVCGSVLASGLVLRCMAELRAARAAYQPTGCYTAGSAFKNPEGKNAWELISAVGLRGARQGRASISEKHANFLLNDDNATAEDLESLGETIRNKVQQKTGIDLEWEIVRLGTRTPTVTDWAQVIGQGSILRGGV
ncbi:MAG: UDP-N-acetylmuramate dehydrogenase [Holosporales bacterium]|jgi:UDP-N-acetylmuramate dehydrogenase|nr:UDP-N-acetylmuramate dehydrogenase [Holosporales bacterium]